MANIQTQAFVERVARGAQVEPEHPRFAAAVKDAINDAISDLNVRADLEVDISLIDSLSDGEIAIAQKFERMMIAGVRYFMEANGVSQIGSAPAGGVDVGELQRRWYDAVDGYYTDALHTLQSDADNDVVGLGAPTD